MGMGLAAFLHGKKTVLKVLIVLHKQVKWRFHLTVFVTIGTYCKNYKKSHLLIFSFQSFPRLLLWIESYYGST